MKSYLSAFFILVSCCGAVAQTGTAKDSTAKKESVPAWTFPVRGALQINQVLASNWTIGGQSTFSIGGTIDAAANYREGAYLWLTDLNFSYGLFKIYDTPLPVPTRKVQDVLELNSVYALRSKDNFYMAAYFNALTQVAPGYNYDEDPFGKSPISNFLAPGFFWEAVAPAYMTDDGSFNIALTPLSMLQVVDLDNKRNNNDQVLEEAEENIDFGVEDGKKVTNEFGIYLQTNFNKEIMENVKLNNRVIVFGPYHDFKETNVNWRTRVTFKVNPFIATNLDIQMLRNDALNGKLQLLQSLGFGLMYAF